MNAVVSEALSIVYRFIMPLCNEQNRSAVERCLLSIAGVSEFNFSGQLMFGVTIQHPSHSALSPQAPDESPQKDSRPVSWLC